MAGLASLREVPGHMVRIGRALEVLQMAVYARGAVQRVVVIDVTIGALTRRYGVHACQHKPCRRMVELAVGPLHGVMALFAGRRKARVRHRRGGAGEIFLVT